MAAISLSDETTVGLLAPLAVFWVYSGIYEAVGSFTEKYRMFPREEEDCQNVITRWQALRGVLFNQAFQLLFNFIFLWVQGGGGGGGGGRPQPAVYVQAAQIVVGMVVVDVWQYFGHRLFHRNRFLYKHIHALHHHLVVPYAFGAQYQHPVEALLLDNVSVALGYAAAGMTPRTGAVFFSLTLVKSIDDHSGLWLPGHPLHRLFGSNSAFHTVHHQLYGGKANFSAPYFVFWDKLMGTYMPYTVERREGGGYQLKPASSCPKKED